MDTSRATKGFLRHPATIGALVLASLALGCDGIGDAQKAYVRFQEAKALEQGGRLDDAAACMAEAVRLDPGDVGYRLKLGYLLHGRGRTEEAIRQFRRAKEIAPDDLAPREGLAWCYVKLDAPEAVGEIRALLERNPRSRVFREQLAAILARKPATLPEAVAEYGRLSQAEPAVGRYHTGRGRCLAALGRRDEAIEAYRGAVRVEPALDEGLVLLAGALHEAGRAEEAIALLREALKLKPDRWVVREKLADLYAAAEATRDRAVGEYKLVQDNTPEDPELRAKIARTLVALGRLDDAVTHVRSALSRSPEREDLQFLLAGTLKQVGKRDEAIETLRDFQEARPESYGVAVNLGFLYLEANRTEDAEGQFRRALSLKPDDEPALEGLAWTLAARGDGRGVEAIEGALNAKPDRSSLRERLADLYSRDPATRERANAHLRIVIAARPENAGARAKLARNLAAMGRFDEALPHLEAIVAADPRLEEMQFLLADALKALKRPADAIEALRRYARAVPGHGNGVAVSLGYLLLEQGKALEAAAEFRAALAIKPDETAALEGLAWALVKAGDKDAAIATIDRVLERQPANQPLRSALLYLLAERPEDLERAIADCRRLIEGAPADLALRRQLLDMVWARGDATEFRTEAQALLALAPTDWVTRMRLAELSRRDGRADNAARQYHAILSSTRGGTEEAATLTALGYLLKDEGRLVEAAATFEKALAVEPESLYLPAVEGLAWTTVRQGDRRKALAYLEQIIGRYPGRTEVRETLADLLAEDEATANRAALEYKALIQALPGEARLRRKRVQALAKAGRLGEAGDEGEVAVAAFPEDGELRSVLLDVLFRAKDLDRAARIYRQILKTAPYDLDRRIGFAYGLFDAGKLNEAIAEFEAAAEVKPADPRAHEGLLWCHLKLRNRPAALGKLRHLLALDPRKRKLHMLYADLLSEDVATVDQAAREYERLLGGLPYDPAGDATLGRTAEKPKPEPAGGRRMGDPER